MKLKRTIIVLVLFILAVPTVAFGSEHGDKIESGETINGDLTLYTDTEIEEGATVNGNVAVFGGKLELDGAINGDLIVFGGDVDVAGTVTGRIAIIAGDLSISSTAAINGECVLVGGRINGEHDCFNPVSAEFDLEAWQSFATLSDFKVPPAEVSAIEPSQTIGFFSAAISMAFTAIVVGGVAFLVASAIPGRLYEVRSAIKYTPYAAGGIGLLTAIAGSSFLTLTSPIWILTLAFLTLICGLGIFLALAGLFYLGAVSLIGWIAIGTLTAKRLIGQMDDALAAAIGTGGLTFVFGVLGIALPGLTGFIGFMLFCVGLGGVVLTRLGRQPYPAEQPFINDIKIERVMSTLPQE